MGHGTGRSDEGLSRCAREIDVISHQRRDGGSLAQSGPSELLQQLSIDDPPPLSRMYAAGDGRASMKRFNPPFPIMPAPRSAEPVSVTSIR